MARVLFGHGHGNGKERSDDRCAYLLFYRHAALTDVMAFIFVFLEGYFLLFFTRLLFFTALTFVFAVSLSAFLSLGRMHIVIVYPLHH